MVKDFINHIVFTEFFLFPNQSENGKYNLILVDLTKSRTDFSVCWLNFFRLHYVQRNGC